METGKIVLLLALSLLLGITFGKAAKKLRLPSVTGYLFSGILFGPYLLGALDIGGFSLGLNEEFIESVKIIYTIAFCFICFCLGEELKAKKLRSMGKKAILIAFIQSFSAIFLVGGALIIFALLTNEKYITVSIALVLAALAAASAPTAKYMITRQYKTEGEITDMMIPIVALDDFFFVIFFSIILSFVPFLEGEGLSVQSLLLAPILEILISLSIGIILGILLGYITKVFRLKNARVAVVIAFVLSAAALSEIITFTIGHTHIHISSLLTTLTMGGAFSFINHEHGIRRNIDSWSYPMFVVFFVLAGAGLNIKVFASPSILLIGLIYFVFRFIGKYFGTRLGARLANEGIKMQKYLGITLLPQADVVLSLAAFAVSIVTKNEGEIILSVIFLAAIIFEIIGHIWIRIGLKRAGEVKGDMDEELELEDEEYA